MRRLSMWKWGWSTESACLWMSFTEEWHTLVTGKIRWQNLLQQQEYNQDKSFSIDNFLTIIPVRYWFFFSYFPLLQDFQCSTLQTSSTYDRKNSYMHIWPQITKRVQRTLPIRRCMDTFTHDEWSYVAIQKYEHEAEGREGSFHCTQMRGYGEMGEDIILWYTDIPRIIPISLSLSLTHTQAHCNSGEISLPAIERKAD